MFLFCVVRGIFHFREIGSAGSIYGFDSRVSRASQALLNPRTSSEGCGWDFGDLLKSSWGDGRRGTTTTSAHADGSHQWPRGSAGPWARRYPSSVSNSDTSWPIPVHVGRRRGSGCGPCQFSPSPDHPRSRLLASIVNWGDVRLSSHSAKEKEPSRLSPPREAAISLSSAS